MNGRMYDPVIGRFLSPDNYVQAPLNTQCYNRYSYCVNNPLKYTDPSGQWFWVPVAIYLGYMYLKGAHDNKSKSGNWEWKPWNWGGKDKPGVQVGFSTNSNFSNVNCSVSLTNTTSSAGVSYNSKYGVGSAFNINGFTNYYYPNAPTVNAEAAVNNGINEMKEHNKNTLSVEYNKKKGVGFGSEFGILGISVQFDVDIKSSKYDWKGNKKGDIYGFSVEIPLVFGYGYEKNKTTGESNHYTKIGVFNYDKNEIPQLELFKLGFHVSEGVEFKLLLTNPDFELINPVDDSYWYMNVLGK